jgi:hypothetical protein
MTEATGGGVSPLNFTVYLDFPAAELEEALTYLFGEGFALQEGSEAGTRVGLREDVDFAGDKMSFHHLLRFLTFRHEALHMRHLAGGVLGLVNYTVGATQYARMVHELGRWGQRIAGEPDVDCQLPLLHHHASDEEMAQIGQIRADHGLMGATVMGGLGDAQLLETASSAGRALLDFLASECVRVLKLPHQQLPEMLADPWDAPVEPAGMTGRAVLEGLARCNEYLLAGHLGADQKTLNLLFKKKHHGEYALALDLVRKDLDLTLWGAIRATAHLADLALQAPWLPFLLEGRGRVDFKELLPSWRFLLLLNRSQERRLTEEDFQKDPHGVAETLFRELKWESPRQLAERVLATEIPEPKSLLTRHYVRCLKQGAQLRLDAPEVFVLPFQSEGSRLLEPVYYLLRDRVIPGAAGLLTADPRYAQLFLLLIDDALIDDLLVREDLSLSTVIAQRFLEAAGQKSDEAQRNAEAHVRRRLEHIVGPVAKRILDGIADLAASEGADPAGIEGLQARAQEQYEEGDFAGAVTRQEKYLAEVQRLVGRDAPAAVTATNNLAVILQKTGNYARARILQERVLKAQVAAHGEEHESTLAAMINLATTLRHLGDAEGAQQLNEKVMTIGLRVLGEKDERTLKSMSHFARGLALNGDFGRAAELEECVLRVLTETRGDKHRDTLRAMNNLAHTLGHAGRSEEAKAMHERTLALHRRVYGDEHPETLSSMANLADVLADLGNFETAEVLQRQVYETSRASSGEADPNTLRAMESLARTLLRSNRPAEARMLYEAALDHREMEQGGLHPHTTLTAFGLYATLRTLGDEAEASSVRTEYLDWVLESDLDRLSLEQRAIRDALGSRLLKGNPSP